MQPLPIQSYKQRLACYHEELRRFVLYECSWMFALSLFLCEGLAYLAAPHLPEDAMDWWLIGLLLAIVLMVPPILLMKPRRPEPEDVLLDQQLRRSVGMDDTVQH